MIDGEIILRGRLEHWVRRLIESLEFSGLSCVERVGLDWLIGPECEERRGRLYTTEFSIKRAECPVRVADAFPIEAGFYFFFFLEVADDTLDVHTYGVVM
jgi:hypothetical protein